MSHWRAFARPFRLYARKIFVRGVNESSTIFGNVAQWAPLARKRRGEHSRANAAERRGTAQKK
jgi:hypothetical protein